MKIKMSQAGNNRGFTYIQMMIAIIAFSIMAGTTTFNVSYHARLEKEEELLFRGAAYMDAIERYYQTHGIYPKKLSHLLSDPLKSNIRHIRALYEDPITRKSWQLIPASDGGIAGVYSSSQSSPLKKRNFPENLKHLKDASVYDQWKFEYKAALSTPSLPQGTTPSFPIFLNN